MANKANQHFVPKFFFKLFNGRERYIHLATKQDTKIVKFASIRHQCARHKYYGSKEFEDFLETYDGRHSLALNRLICDLHAPGDVPIAFDQMQSLCEFLSLQRARVPRAAEKLAAMNRQLTLGFLGDIIRTSPRTARNVQILDAIADDTITLDQDPLANIMLAMEGGLTRWKLLSDLQPLLVRNQTDVPFIFGDSPVVFHNEYLHQYNDVVGTIGSGSPGLLVITPIGTNTTLIFYDDAVYQSESSIVNLVDCDVVSNLNALQAHAAIQNVYFSLDCEDYVQDLLNTHRAHFKTTYSSTYTAPAGTVLVGGTPTENEVVITLEQQIPIRLQLPFLTFPSPPPTHELPSCRNLAIMNSVRGPTATAAGDGISADKFLAETLSKIKLPND